MKYTEKRTTMTASTAMLVRGKRPIRCIPDCPCRFGFGRENIIDREEGAALDLVFVRVATAGEIVDQEIFDVRVDHANLGVLPARIKVGDQLERYTYEE